MSRITQTQPTTVQSLGALLKSARSIIRNDKGPNGDLDRLPMPCSVAVLGCGLKRRLAARRRSLAYLSCWQRDAAVTRRRGRLRYGHA